MVNPNIENLTDYEVVTTVLGGDKNAFAVLVSRYKNLVYSIIMRMVNDTELAADLSQEVFIKIFKNLDKYRTSYKFSTWIIKITTNRVIDYRRQKKDVTVSFDEVAEEPRLADTPLDYIESKERSQTIWGAVDTLPDMYKIPIVLYHQQGLSYQEIADITGEPLSKVKNRIFRGRKILKDELIEYRKVREVYGM